MKASRDNVPGNFCCFHRIFDQGRHSKDCTFSPVKHQELKGKSKAHHYELTTRALGLKQHLS